MYFVPFVVGASLNGATAWLKRHSNWSGLFFLIALICGCYDLSTAFAWMSALVPHGVEKRTFWYAIGAPFMVASVIGSVPLAKFFGSRPIAYFGRLSFSLYLLHWPIIFSFSILAIERFQAWGIGYGHAASYSFVCSFVVLVALSEILCRYVDVTSTQFANWLAKRIFALTRKVYPLAISTK